MRAGGARAVIEKKVERLPAMPRAGGAAREEASQELRDLLVRTALAYLLRQQYPAEALGACRR